MLAHEISDPMLICILQWNAEVLHIEAARGKKNYAAPTAILGLNTVQKNVYRYLYICGSGFNNEKYAGL
jgi:hypothetical protein